MEQQEGILRKCGPTLWASQDLASTIITLHMPSVSCSVMSTPSFSIAFPCETLYPPSVICKQHSPLYVSCLFFAPHPSCLIFPETWTWRAITFPTWRSAQLPRRSSSLGGYLLPSLGTISFPSSLWRWRISGKIYCQKPWFFVKYFLNKHLLFLIHSSSFSFCSFIKVKSEYLELGRMFFSCLPFSPH